MNKIKPNNKLIVITGGNRGLGKALVKKASRDAQTIFTYKDNLNEAEELYKKTGSDFFRLDLSKKNSIDIFLKKLKRPVDYFIANAGIEFSGKLDKHTYKKIDKIIKVNLIGNLYLLRGLIINKHMAERGQISVIGALASRGNKDQLAYSASKAGLRGAIESLYRYDSYVKKQNIGIKLLEPVFIKTPMSEKILRVLEKIIYKKRGKKLLKQFKRDYVIEINQAAKEILSLTADSNVIGIRQIPKNADLHKMRKNICELRK